MQPTLLVMTSLPDTASARTLAQALVEQRLAACVNLLAPCQSIYRWKGHIESGTEIPLCIKTPARLYDKVEATIRAHHPYELPEIVAVSITAALPAYLDWVASETTPDTESA